MDSGTFDRLVAEAARPTTRRSTLRLLAGGLLGGVFAVRGAVAARAGDRPDRDFDGLYDDDETDVYGTNPDVADTDGDGPDDGQEVYDGTDPLTPNGGGSEPDPAPAEPAPAELICPEGTTNCYGAFCAATLVDPNNCGVCGGVCGPLAQCLQGTCIQVFNPAPAPAPCQGLYCPPPLTVPQL